MTKSWVALLAACALAGCGTASGSGPIPDAGGSTMWTPVSTSSSAAVVARPVCRSATLGPSGSIAQQEQVDAVADRVRAVAGSQSPNGFSTLSVDPASLTVRVRWVGAVPPALSRLVDAAVPVHVEIAPAAFTAVEMMRAQELVMATTSASLGSDAKDLVVAATMTCDDGTGIRAEVADRTTGGPPTAVPSSLVDAIQARAGEVPVLVVPGSVVHPQ